MMIQKAVFIVMPATNAASERSFSVLHRIKSYLRSTMQYDSAKTKPPDDSQHIATRKH